MVSQFVSSHVVPLLADLPFDFPEGTHAIGRLDRHSEGLLLLTTDKRITKLLFESDTPHARTYMVQVVYAMTERDLESIRSGVKISAKDGTTYTTRPCSASIVEQPGYLWAGHGNIPAHVSSSWVAISLTEGKYHQVRKMVRALGYRCRRLIRTSIEKVSVEGLQPGEVREISREAFFKGLRLNT